jgi:hypothetical protein
MRYFKGSIIFSILGLIGSFFVGHYYSGTYTGALSALFVASILAVLEVSLSFDNAIVNAVVLKEMTPVWKQRFLTWGMLIAVFGMRLIFPLLIVTFAAQINPWEALVMAATRPDEYAKLMLGAHLKVAAFGGAFLLMVALKYFYDEAKELHWIPFIEKPSVYLGSKVEAIEVALCIVILLLVTQFLNESEGMTFLVSGLAGLITYVIVDGIGSWLEGSEDTIKDVHKASAGLFIYLEVLDASFSFDGVVGAFAITNNLFIIMIGLSIGAFFVRSLTIMFVEKETLTKFAFLEHGAFYAIGILSIIMLSSPFLHVPEWFTGLSGGAVILTSFVWSLTHTKTPKMS